MSSSLLFDLIYANNVAELKEGISSGELTPFIHAVNEKGDFPLHTAVKMRSLEAVETLLVAGADPNTKSNAAGNHRGYTAAHHCAAMNETRLLTLLQRYNADFDAESAEKWSPLHCAAYRGHHAAMSALLDLGAEIDSVNNAGQTALDVSCSHGRVAEVRFLLARGASVKVRDTNGDGVLHHAFHYQMSRLFDGEYDVPESQLDVSVVLAVHGASIDDANMDGALATHYIGQHLPTLEKVLRCVCANHVKLQQFKKGWNYMSLVSLQSTHFVDLGLNEASAGEMCDAVQQLEVERKMWMGNHAEAIHTDHSPTLALNSIPEGYDPSGGKCPFFRRPTAGKPSEIPRWPFHAVLTIPRKTMFAFGITFICGVLCGRFMGSSRWSK